jgi:hypothetical protein
MLEQTAQHSTITFLGILASLVGGGLSGGCVSLFFNRLWHLRAQRTQFYPKVNNLYSAYVIRFQNPTGRYWVNIVGNNPSPADAQFVRHRSEFIMDLVQFNELKEARALRQKMVGNSMTGHGMTGLPNTLDLGPEEIALKTCLGNLQKKLGLV